MNIEELYRTYFDIVDRYIRSVSQDGALAEEVTQETFFKALKKADQFRGDCDVRVWLCQIAKNTLYDHLKKQKKQLPKKQQSKKEPVSDQAQKGKIKEISLTGNKGNTGNTAKLRPMHRTGFSGGG